MRLQLVSKICCVASGGERPRLTEFWPREWGLAKLSVGRPGVGKAQELCMWRCAVRGVMGRTGLGEEKNKGVMLN